MKTKIIALLMIVIIAVSIISGCVEKNKNTPAANNSAAISANTPKPSDKAYVKAVVITPTSKPEQKIPVSEEPKLTIASPEIVSQGEDFIVALALEPCAGQKIVAVEVDIVFGNQISANSIEFISSNPEADKVIQKKTISYANTNGIAGDFAVIKFSAIQKGQAEITMKATVVDENQFSAELMAKKTIKIV